MQNFGFGGLQQELPLEIGGALAEAAELFAGRGQFRRRRFGFAALAIAAQLDVLHRAFVVGDADLHRLDLGAQRRKLDALAVGRDRMLAQLGDQLDQLGFLVGERALDFAQRAVLDLEFLFGGAQLLALGLVAGLEREDRRGLLAELLLELIDGVGLLAELGKLRRRLGLHLRHAHFEAAGRHGEFGAQLVLVGADFGDRQRRRRFEAAHGQAHGTVMNQRDEQQSEQRRNQETDAEIHDRFDHETTPPSASQHPAMRIRTAPHSPAVNLNRLSPPRHC